MKPESPDPIQALLAIAAALGVEVCAGSSAPLTIDEASRALGMSRRTLERALAAGAADVEGEPWCVTPTTKRRTWRFDPLTVRAWWRRWSRSQLPTRPDAVDDPRAVKRRKRRQGESRKATHNYRAEILGDS